MSKKHSNGSRYYTVSNKKREKHNMRGYNDYDDDSDNDSSYYDNNDGLSKIGEDCKNVLEDLKEGLGQYVNSNHSHGASKHKSSFSMKKIKKNLSSGNKTFGVLLALGGIGVVLLASTLGTGVVVVVLIGLLLYLLLS